MTAQDFLQNSLTISHFYNDRYNKMTCFSKDVQRAMKEFAELKCKELLEIVAEKAKTKHYSTNTSIDFSKLVVDKDSILNAVDLKEFIK